MVKYFIVSLKYVVDFWLFKTVENKSAFVINQKYFKIFGMLNYSILKKKTVVYW